MAKQPYIPLYTGDYLKDTRRLTLELRGAWIDLLIFMWESDEKGTITATLDEFALMMGCSLKKADEIIATLQEKKICDFEIKKDGKIKLISRRMIRDAEVSKARSEAGKKGAEKFCQGKTQGKSQAKHRANSDIDIDNDINTVKESTKIVDSFETGAEAFEEIKNDDRLVERVVRIARNSGYISYTEMQVMKGVKHFLTIEEAKPDFTYRPRDEIKKHLVNWINSNAKKLADYG